jgi:hypothetical protein
MPSDRRGSPRRRAVVQPRTLDVLFGRFLAAEPLPPRLAHLLLQLVDSLTERRWPAP